MSGKAAGCFSADSEKIIKQYLTNITENDNIQSVSRRRQWVPLGIRIKTPAEEKLHSQIVEF